MDFSKLFKDFFDSEKIGGLILLGCTIISLFIANSSFGETYNQFWHSYADLSFSSLNLKYSIEHWINDGLMTIFFLLVGLEIERELYKGELTSLKNALLPIGAAVGGMVVPAGIYFLVNLQSGNTAGFGIPMATDIAFALGMLALAGSRVPFSLKIFLTALAIIDDLGAITIIAIFYNTGISWAFLVSAMGIFFILMIMNKLGVKNLIFYLVPGVVMWYCMLQSGVHATITGVLLAFAIPFHDNDRKNPSYHLQHFLHRPVAFIILPIFALANTGIHLSGEWMKELLSSNSLGIMAGLVLGKPLGILLFSWVLLKTKLTSLPQNVNWKHMLGAGILAGIGFTMSIFISNLAFTDSGVIQNSKIAVLIASLVATCVGLVILFTSPKIKE
ncbi:MAG TPA: Na+/H+ antiporter NhaA [Flavisolibacter sp.]|nr:Na+/H+ antiporter NhaA [Flavisolibacter sp.]